MYRRVGRGSRKPQALGLKSGLSRFAVCVFGFRAYRVKGLGFRVLGLTAVWGCSVGDYGFRVWGFNAVRGWAPKGHQEIDGRPTIQSHLRD